MWTYIQATGQLFHGRDRKPIAVGYSGRGSCKNRPESQQIRDWGPLPVGMYSMLRPVDSERLGPCSIPLVPDADNAMFGRSGFFIHGASWSNPEESSEGCIILPHAVREEIAASGDDRLFVTANLADHMEWCGGVENGGDTTGDPAAIDEPGA